MEEDSVEPAPVKALTPRQAQLGRGGLESRISHTDLPASA
jgi:hypothetical protein